MSKRVLDVGQCDADHAAIRRMLETNFDGVEVVRADGPKDALAHLRAGRIDLVLVNRKLDRDDSDGLEIIKSIKADAGIAETPCILVTNFPKHQDAAVAAGAKRGFGKNELAAPQTQERLAAFLAE